MNKLRSGLLIANKKIKITKYLAPRPTCSAVIVSAADASYAAVAVTCLLESSASETGVDIEGNMKLRWRISSTSCPDIGSHWLSAWKSLNNNLCRPERGYNRLVGPPRRKVAALFRTSDLISAPSFCIAGEIFHWQAKTEKRTFSGYLCWQRGLCMA